MSTGDKSVLTNVGCAGEIALKLGGMLKDGAASGVWSVAYDDVRITY